MPSYVQANRPLKVATTLGEDKLLLAGVQGREGVSQPYEYRLDLRSEDPAVDGAALLRGPIAVSIDTDADQPRYIHGVARRFAQHGRRDNLYAYELDIVPWFWLLSLSRDCRIFQNLSVLEIVQQVFQDLGFKPTENFRNACTKSYAKREYCVQYRETHMDFVSRLLEDEGILYFFEHLEDKHVLVLADGNSAFPTSAISPKLRMSSQADDGGTLDVVGSLAGEQAVHTGKVTLKDYDYLQPALTLEGSISGTGPEEVYDYPGGFTAREDGERRARLQLEAEEAVQKLVRCRSTCRGVQAGTRFDLENHYRSDVNQNYVVLEVSLAASAENFLGWEGSAFEYRNEFLAIPFTTPYRPHRRTPRPLVAGTQTALVVGPAGEEVWVDKHGRVKVQFYWDRLGHKDDKSSCWVRVSTMWAGKGWGSVSIPRIGNEVVVDFLEGDPDRPLIVGSVYNADQTPPFTLPGAGIQMGMKSRTSKGGGGMNEITMTDTKGKELINIHAQYDMTTLVEHDMTTTVKNDDTQTVKVNRTIGVDGKHAEHVKGDVTETYDSTQTTTVKSDITIKSTAGTISVIAGAKNILVKGTTDIKIEVGASKITMDAGGQIRIEGVDVAIKGSASVGIKGAMVASEADAQHQTKGAIVLSEGSATNTIKGGMVMLNP